MQVPPRSRSELGGLLKLGELGGRRREMGLRDFLFSRARVSRRSRGWVAREQRNSIYLFQRNYGVAVAKIYKPPNREVLICSENYRIGRYIIFRGRSNS